MDSKSKLSDKLLTWKSLLLQLFWALLGRLSFSNLSHLGQGGAASSSCTDSNRIQSYRYDVFISFRGPDTRNTFVDHLYAHLTRKGIFAFKDDKRLEKGDSLSPQLLQAIKNSRISIVIFSKKYAESRWCLEEMATIAECHKQLKQKVFPVFYDVDPSHVRRQSGEYENAFVLHKKKLKHDPDKVMRWTRAMVYLAELVGWHVSDKPEFQEIENIVQQVIGTLGHKSSGFDDLIGIQPRVEALESLLKLSSEDDEFRVIGIWGMGGIGKTTLATVLYDRISCQFDACCFIENVSKIYGDGGSAIDVQKQILRQTLDEINLERYNRSEISGIVSNRLCNRKILVVLDNVDQLEQVKELAIDPKLLHTGSRIIITTRDVHILKVYGAHAVYEVPLLNNNDAHELFCRRAFKSEDQSNHCVELILEALRYAKNLPLAVKVLGSFLCMRDATQWRDALDRLRNNPDKEVMDVLQLSVDGLQHEEKEIFLHIACFFRGEREEYVKRILDACGLHPHIGIQTMLEKSLITIRNEEIHMHEILQELGKKIARHQFPEEPGSWSRLWQCGDFHHVLMTETGTNNVKAIVLVQKENVSTCRAEGFSNMRNLRLLILYHNNFSGNFNFLSNNLRYLLWHGYPFTSLPSNFEPYYLVELNMPDSSIQQLWEGRKDLPYLKRMDFSNSKYLIETPKFFWTPKLERLDFTGCTNLSQVHPSIGHLTKLAFLSLQNCISLETLNFGRVSNLSCLRVLRLSGCTKLKKTPDFTGASNLEYLDMDRCTSLSTVHESMEALAKLRFLSLRDCTNLVGIPNNINTMTSLETLVLCGCLKLTTLGLKLALKSYSDLGWKLALKSSSDLGLIQALKSYSDMKSLIFLNLSFCNLREVPDAIEGLKSLERLNLQGNNFDSLPRTIPMLRSLAYLNLTHCHELQTFPELPSENASSVGRYFKTESGSRDHRSGLYIFDCPKMKWSSIKCLCVKNDIRQWLLRFVEKPRHFRCGFDIIVPWDWETNDSLDLIPLWFEHQFDGGSIIRIIQSNVDDNWLGFTFCVAFEVKNCLTNSGSSHDSFSSPLPHPFYLSFESEDTEERFDMPLSLELDKIDGSKYLWVIYISREHCHFVKTGAHISFKACSSLMIKKWGLHIQTNEETKYHLLDSLFDYISIPRSMQEQELELELELEERLLAQLPLQPLQQQLLRKKMRLLWKQKLLRLQLQEEEQLQLEQRMQQLEQRLQQLRLLLAFDYVKESSSSSEPKIQLPYNWLVTEEEEVENLEAKSKEKNLSNMGF